MYVRLIVLKAIFLCPTPWLSVLVLGYMYVAVQLECPGYCHFGEGLSILYFQVGGTITTLNFTISNNSELLATTSCSEPFMNYNSEEGLVLQINSNVFVRSCLKTVLAKHCSSK